jgi:DNA-binding MarR family transcriptional regulator
MAGRRTVSSDEYRTLAAFRYALARFLGFSAAAAAGAGLTPRQYQALLAVKGHGNSQPLTVGELAERLQVYHHSAVGLVDRLVALGLAERSAGRSDRRRVHVLLTPEGERRLGRLAAAHRDELAEMAGPLRTLLGKISKRSVGARRSART